KIHGSRLSSACYNGQMEILMPTMARVLAAMGCIWLATQSRAEPPLTVFAAASLKTALDRANEAFAAVSKITVRTSYAASSALGPGRLALAEVNSVPAGRYAKAALQHLRLWDGLAARLAMAENVRAALIFVSRGEAPLGIVYATDAAADPGVKIVAIFPPESH